MHDHSQDSPRLRHTPQPKVSPSPSQPWPSTEPAQGAASAHRAPRGRGFAGGKSLKGWVPARRRQESRRPRHTMGTVPEAVGRMRPSSSVPDSHPHPLGQRRHRATAPAPIPAALGHRTGAGGDPSPAGTLCHPVPELLPPKQPCRESPRAGTRGAGSQSRWSLAPEPALPGTSCSRARRLH